MAVRKNTIVSDSEEESRKYRRVETIKELTETSELIRLAESLVARSRTYYVRILRDMSVINVLVFKINTAD